MSEPSLADVLSLPEDTALSRAERLIAHEEHLARLQAELDAARTSHYADVHTYCTTTDETTHGDYFDARVKSLATDLGLATRVSDRTIHVRLGDAVELATRYPAALDALREGRISLAHTRVISQAGTALATDELRARYEELVLPHALERTPGRLRSIAERIAADLDPATIATRHAEAARRRDVQLREIGDGLTELIASLPSIEAHAIHDRLTQLARANARDRAEAAQAPASEYDGAFGHARLDITADAECGTDTDAAPVDDRRFGEVRADALVELLLAGTVTDTSRHAAINAIRARVAITVPALTLIGADGAPAVLDGVGPLPLDTAMRLCAGATVWLRVCTDPVTGEPLAADTYRPTAELRRFIEARDRTCRMPGCGTPARDCDLDHTLAWADGGRTTADNLAGLCRYHHTLKHAGWRLEQLPRGVLRWTSPTGRRYQQRPAPIARPYPNPMSGPGTARATAPPRTPSTRPHPPSGGHRPRPEFAPAITLARTDDADDPAESTGPRSWRHTHWEPLDALGVGHIGAPEHPHAQEHPGAHEHPDDPPPF